MNTKHFAMLLLVPLALAACARPAPPDLRATLNLPNEFDATRDLLAPLVEAFRKAAGR